VLRHRLGPIAGVALVVLVVVSGVVAVVTGDGRLTALVVYRRLADRPVDVDGFVLILVVAGMVQGWGLWQILGGAGEKADGDGRRLRIALYVLLVVELVDLRWMDIPEQAVRFAVVVLFCRVTRGVSRTLRLVALVAGLHAPVLVLTTALPELFGFDRLVWQSPLAGVPWLVWMVLTLLAQGKDGRWGRTTVVAGAVVATGNFLVRGRRAGAGGGAGPDPPPRARDDLGPALRGGGRAGDRGHGGSRRSKARP
jgi:hypothetical protein